MRTEHDLIAALAALESRAPDADEVMAAVRRRLASRQRARLANLIATPADGLRIRRATRWHPVREISGRTRLIAPLAAAAAVAAIAVTAALIAPRSQPTPLAGAPAHGTKLYPVPTSSWRPGDPSMLALAMGTLAAGTYRGQWCVWLGGRPGSRGLPVVWPAGFRARRHPLELVDSQGTVVARGGEHLKIGGGLRPVSGLAGLDGPRLCMLGQKEAWYANSYPERMGN